MQIHVQWKLRLIYGTWHNSVQIIYKINFNSNSTTNSGIFWKLQFQFQFRSFENISIPIPIPVTLKSFNSNSNSGIGVGIAATIPIPTGIGPNPGIWMLRWVTNTLLESNPLTACILMYCDCFRFGRSNDVPTNKLPSNPVRCMRQSDVGTARYFEEIQYSRGIT